MGETEITSLKGLEGLKGLSETEYASWRKAQEQLGKLTKNSSWKQEDRLYRNQLFVNKFGIDTFNSYDVDQRDAIFRDSLVSEAFNETYNKDGKLSPELEDIKSTDAKLYLIEKGYIPQNQRDKDAENVNNAINKAYEDSINKGNTQFINYPAIGAPISHSTISREAAQRGANLVSKFNKRNDATILEDALVIENESVKKSAEPYKQFYDSQYITQLYSDPDAVNKIEEDFNEVMNMKTEDGTPLFPYWDAYKDSYQLKDWTPEKKASTLAQFNSIMTLSQGKSEEEQLYYYTKALDIINKEFQHEIHENSTFSDRALNNTKAIVTKTTASLAQTLLGMYALGLKAQDIFDNGNRLQTYLSGKDKNGNDLNPFLTLQYYSHLDQYNTWSPEEQNLIFKRGGIGTSTNVRDVGKEYEWFTRESFGDAYAMTGYRASSLGLDYLTLGSGKLLKQTGKLGARLLKGTGMSMRDIAKVHKVFSNPVTEILGDVARMQIHSVSESVLEGMGVYEQVMANQKIIYDKNFNDPRTQEELKTEIDRRTKDIIEAEGLSPNTLKVVTDAEGQMTGATNDYYNKVSEIKKRVTEEVLNEYKAKQQDATEEAAVNAFILEATTKQLKNSIGDNIFKQYMYAKPIKFNKRGKAFHMDDVKLDEAGKLVAKQLTKVDYAKRALKTIVGGGLDEYTDEMLNQGALAYGLNLANDYTNQVLNPEAVNFTSNWYGSLQSYLSGVGDAIFDPSAFQQMFIGAISPITTVTPNVIGITKSLLSKEEKNNLSTAEKINNWITSPVFGEAIGTYQEYKRKEADLQVINEVIKNHKADFESIIPSIKAITDYQNSLINRDIKKQKDSENDMLFQLFKHLEDLSLTSEVSPLYNDYIEKMQNAANGDITNEDIQAFLNTDGNKDLISKLGQAKAEQLARETIKDRATDFFNKQKEYERISSLINDYYGDEYNSNVKDVLKYVALQEYDLQQRVTSLEKSISGKPESSGEFLGFRTEAYRNRLNKIIDAKIQDYNNFIERAKEEDTSKDPIKAKINKKSIDKAKKEIKKLQAERDKNNSYDYKVLRADEIINNTNPYERAVMFTHPQNYTIEQQEEIEKAKDNLNSKNSNYLEDVTDIATLSRRLEESEGVLRAGLENINSLSSYIEIERRSKINAQKEINNQFLADTLYKTLESNNNDFKSLASQINLFPTEVINKIIEEHPDLSEGLNGFKEVIQYKEDAYNVIDNFDIDDSKKNILKQNIGTILSEATNKQEALNIIEDALDNPDITEENKDAINSIAQRLESIGYQRDATRVRNREKEREAKAKYAAQQAAIERAKDGKNFGWEGYKKGTTVYSLDSNGNVKEGYVKEFREGEEMVVHWKGGTKGTDYIYNAKTDKNKLSQSIPQTEAPNTYQQATKVDKDGKNLVSAEAVSTNIPTAEQFTGDAEEVELTPEGMANSPSIENQATQSDSIIIEVPKSDPTDGGNNIQVNTETSLLGHTFYIYDNGQLKNFGIEIRRTPGSENDTMSQFFRWIDENGIKLQEIIDYELGDIIANNPETKIQFLLSKPKGTKGEDAMQDIVLNVIEYTSEIAKYHKPERGGIIQANGKQWLVVGSLGFSAGSKEQQSSFAEIKYQLKVARKQYFDTNPNEQYFVHPNYYTNVKEMASGRIVRQLTTDTEIQYRTISELLSETTRNPEGLELEDLKWGIQQGNKFVTIGFTGEEKFYPPVDPEGTKGGVFLMTKAANGSYIPIAIRPITLTQLRESSLKDQIYDLINQVTAPKRSDRVGTIKQLVQMLNLDEKNNILIGDEKHNNITIVKNGVNIASFELGENFDRAGFISAINKADFRVNITTSVLGDSSKLKSYDEAGALITDAAKLGTSNAWYTVYQVDSTGKPIISQPIDVQSTKIRHNSELTRKSADSFLYKGKTYRLRDNIFYDELGKPIDINSPLYDSLYWNKLVRDSQLQPVLIAKDGTKYYIINNNPNNAKAIKITSDGVATEASHQQSLDLINKVTKQSQDASREQVAQQMLDRADYEQQLREQNKVELLSVEEIDDDIIAEQMSGNFTEQKPEQPIVQPIEERVPETTIKQDVNNAPTKSNLELQSSKTLTNFTELIRSREHRKILMDLAKEKGWNWGNTVESKEAFLKSKGISTTGITNINSWIDMIKNCK